MFSNHKENITAKTLTTKQQSWTDHLQRAEAFDGSIAAYAAKGIAAQSLYRWRHCLGQFDLSASCETRTTFTRVVSTNATRTAGLVPTIGAAQLRFSSLPNAQWQSQLQRVVHQESGSLFTISLCSLILLSSFSSALIRSCSGVIAVLLGVTPDVLCATELSDDPSSNDRHSLLEQILELYDLDQPLATRIPTEIRG